MKAFYVCVCALFKGNHISINIEYLTHTPDISAGVQGLAYIDRVPKLRELNTSCPKNNQLDILQYFQPFQCKKVQRSNNGQRPNLVFLQSELLCTQVYNNNKTSILHQMSYSLLRGSTE